MSVDFAATREAAELPRWDLTALFPGIDRPEFVAGFGAVLTEIEGLGELFDRAGTGATESVPLSEALLADFEEVLNTLNDVTSRVESLAAFLFGQVTTDSRNDAAQARSSELQTKSVALDKLNARFHAWVGALPVEELILHSPAAAAHAYPLRRLHESARFLMSPEEEDLAAELSPTGGSAWSKLHRNASSQIEVALEVEGEARRLPMSEVRNLAMAPDRDTRQQAWEAELEAWEANALPIAAALNGVKGEVLALGLRRGWSDPLDEAIFWSAIDREILEALIGEARASLPDFRCYLRLKAKALNLPELGWYDLFAPVGRASRA